MQRSLALIIFVLLMAADLQAATFRLALIVGNNDGNPGRTPLRYAEQDARNLHRTLVQIGGFPEEQIRLLVGKSSMEEAVRSLRAQALRLVKNPHDQLLLLFYFSGHSEGGFLEMGPSETEFRELREELRRIPNSTRILILDTCQSGQMIRTKGGFPVPPFTTGPEDGAGPPRGEVVITSSTELEDSLESSEIQGSFFTHHFISGIRGAADFNHDGKVSLPEAYSYTRDETAGKTARLQRGQHPSFEFSVSGTGEIYLTDLNRGDPLLSLAPPEEGHFAIYEKKTRGLVAEVDKPAGSPLFIAIPEGEVLIRKRKTGYDLEQDLMARAGGIYHFSEEEGRRVRISPGRRILSPMEVLGKRDGVLLREGELVTLKLLETVTTKTAQVGDKIRLESAGEIYVDGQVVIPAGAPANGEILAIRQKRGIVHGELVCRLGYVRAIDGQWVPLESILSRSPAGLRKVGEGEDPLSTTGSQTETDVASGVTAFFFLPFYPFVKGRDAVLTEGALFDAYVARDVKIR